MAKLNKLIKRTPDNFWVLNKEGDLLKATKSYKPRDGEFIIQMPFWKCFRVTNKSMTPVDVKHMPDIVRLQFDLFNL